MLTQYGTLLVLDFPPNAEFGIDTAAWVVGEKFQGLKLIPPGVHFVFFSVGDKFGSMSPRTGFWINIGAGEVIVRRWGTNEEQILPVGVDYLDDERESFIAGVRRMEFDDRLGPYPVDQLSVWNRLTSFISTHTVDRIQSVSQVVVSSAAAEDSQSRHSSNPSSKTLGNAATQSHTLFFLTIPERVLPPNPNAQQVTKYSMDKSLVLEKVLAELKNEWSELLGEMQFAFVCFMFGQLYEAFEQWKGIVILMCFCEEAILQYVDLFSNFIQSFSDTLPMIPDDFFVDIISKDNFIVKAFSSFFELVDGDISSVSMVAKCEALKSKLFAKFGVDFSMPIDDDDAPVIVSE